jgi:hypothetical protein
LESLEGIFVGWWDLIHTSKAHLLGEIKAEAAEK